MEKISFSQFKRATHHQPMRYRWKKKDGSVVKEFHTDKFYCNPCGKGEDAMLSMPQFSLSKIAAWYKSRDKYVHVSEYGTTEFIPVKQ